MADSKLATILPHALAIFCGYIGWYISTFIAIFLSGAYRPDKKFDVMNGLFSFITFLLLGALLGFLFNKLGWKLGLSLASFVIIVWGFVFGVHIFWGVRTAFSDTTSFEGFIRLILYTFPELIGGCLGAYLGAESRNRRTHKGDYQTNF